MLSPRTFRLKCAALVLIATAVASMLPPQFAHAEQSLAVFVTQRNVVVAPGDSSQGITGAEFSGTIDGPTAAVGQFFPFGLEYGWRKDGGLGPIARLRLAPVTLRVQQGGASESGLDAQFQAGHSWVGPTWGDLKTRFEFGVSARGFFFESRRAVDNSGLAGLFWGAEIGTSLWTHLFEGSILGLGLGGQGRWGVHRDSNALRLKSGRLTSEGSRYKIFGEFFHLHRTFTGGSLSTNGASFVSDLSLSLGVEIGLD